MGKEEFGSITLCNNGNDSMYVTCNSSNGR